MYLYCDCLNISLSCNNVDFAPVDSKISNSFTNDSFFDGKIGLLSPCSINTQVSSLMKERETGHWKIAICKNCEKACYATSRTLGVNSVIASKLLRSDVDKLTQSDLYSPVFKIIIDTNDLSSDEETDRDQKTYLCPAAASWLSEQTALAEERVKIFSDKEFSALDELRKRIYKEQRAIKRLEKKSAKDSLKASHIENLTDSFSKTLHFEKKKLIGRKPSFDDNSIDSEGVFLLDGFDTDGHDRNLAKECDSDESDDESASYHPRKVANAQLAKSLPIPVPQFMEVEEILERQRNDPSFGTPDVPSDIAASMKALAKSIHGDSIFGELPPPRFSTHL